MKARARLVVSRDSRGRNVVSEQRCDVPILFRHARDAIWLVGGAAGPLGGDDLELEVVVQAGASVVVRSVATSVVLPGRDGAWSHASIHAEVGPDAALEWAPEPLVAAAGCRHRSHTSIVLQRGARLSWREVLVLGRIGENPGDLVAALHVTRESCPIVRQELCLGPSAPGWDGPAVLDGARAVGTLALVGVGAPPRPIDHVTARMRSLVLEGGEVLVSALGEPSAVAAMLDRDPETSRKGAPTCAVHLAPGG